MRESPEATQPRRLRRDPGSVLPRRNTSPYFSRQNEPYLMPNPPINSFAEISPLVCKAYLRLWTKMNLSNHHCQEWDVKGFSDYLFWSLPVRWCCRGFFSR